jgi:hypothetical protein
MPLDLDLPKQDGRQFICLPHAIDPYPNISKNGRRSALTGEAYHQ